MEKLLRFCSGKNESHSHFSDLFRGWGCSLPNKRFGKLHKAASAGDLEKLKEYLQLKKYDVNTQDKDLRTPLHLACANGYTNIVSLLIEKKCKIDVQDSENRSPLIKAVQYQKENCATVLLYHGADPNLLDIHYNTALHYAVCGHSVSLVEKLLKHKANLEAKNKDGYTPLLLAVSEKKSEMAEFLLEKGADVNTSDKNQRTALMISLSEEPTSIVSHLLQYDVDLSCQDIYGFTAEEYASFNGFTMAFKEVMQLSEMRRVVPIQSDWCHYNKVLGHTESHQGDSCMEAQMTYEQRQQEERPEAAPSLRTLRGSQPSWHLDVERSASVKGERLIRSEEKPEYKPLELRGNTFLFLPPRYHQLIANDGKENKVKQKCF